MGTAEQWDQWTAQVKVASFFSHFFVVFSRHLRALVSSYGLRRDHVTADVDR